MEHVLLTALSSVTGFLLAVIGFFLKKLFVQIKENHDELITFKGTFESRVHMLEKDIISSFHGVCHERQNSCVAVQEIKLTALREADILTSSMIRQFVADTNEAWKEQKRINGTLFKRITGSGGGRSNV